jgi:hypothetical protein
MHPITYEAAEVATLEDGVMTVDASGRARLAQSLGALASSAALPYAVRSLLAMACTAHGAGHTEFARVLVEIAATAQPALVRLELSSNAARNDQTAASFGRFSGAPPARAPAVGAVAPKGSVPLIRLLPIPRRF